MTLTIWSTLALTVAAQGQGGGRGGSTGQLPLGTHEAEIVRLTPRGFEPAQIIRRPGLFHLLVKDASGRTNLDLEIVDERGNSQKSADVDKAKARDFNGTLDLTPGRYTLRLRSVPTTSMTIMIDPNRK